MIFPYWDACPGHTSCCELLHCALAEDGHWAVSIYLVYCEADCEVT